MWLFTNKGFFSVVQKNGDKYLTVRSRVKQDLENFLCFYLKKEYPIQETSTDYQFRIRVPRSEFNFVMKAVVNEIDYDNFKDSVKRLQGKDREEIYTEIWAILKERLENCSTDQGQINFWRNLIIRLNQEV